MVHKYSLREKSHHLRLQVDIQDFQTAQVHGITTRTERLTNHIQDFASTMVHGGM